jgi:plasmid stabilization system protein ParE
LAEINWTRESEIWLKDIYDYIAAENPNAAAETITNIYGKSQLLRDHPRLGPRYEAEQTREVRILLYEHYRITYLIKPDGNIDILGIFHGALDIDRYFI